MQIIISGEGPTDIGHDCFGCGETLFSPGPMAIIIDRLLQKHIGYSVLESTPTCVIFVSKSKLQQVGKSQKTKRSSRAIALPGDKRPTGTSFFYRNAQALASIALEASAKDKDTIAFLFRDTDLTRSSDKSLWDDKNQSILTGFESLGFATGIPMLPKPKSEAWLLCCCHDSDNCEAIELRTGNDKSTHPIKEAIADCILERQLALTELASLCISDETGFSKLLSMPSFSAFYHRLLAVLSSLKIHIPCKQ